MFFKKNTVPVVMQMEALECGAACLAMILAYHGKWIPLEKVRSDCAVSRDGSNLRDMVDAACAYGLEPEAYKCGIEDLKTLPLPAIVHWNFNHFVVLNKIKKNKAVITDPARGTLTVSIDEFDRAFTGVILCLEKGPDFKKGGRPKSVLSFARDRLKGTLVPFLFVIFTGILITATDLINPGVSRVFMDRILIKPGAEVAENPEWLYAVISLMAGLVIFQLIVRSIKEIYMLKIRGKLAIIANSMFMWHVLRLPMDFFSQRNIGDIAERQSSNESIAETLIQSFAPILLDLVMLIFYLLVIIKISVVLTIIGISSSLLNIFIGRYISKKRINISRAQMRDSGKLISTTISGIEMIETIKSSGAENGFFERWAGYQASVNASRVKSEKLNQYLGSIPAILEGLSDIGVLMIGTMLIMSGHFTIGLLTQFKSLLEMFIGPIDRLRGTGQQVQEMRTLMERIDDVMNYSPDIEYKDENKIINSEKEYKKLSGNLEMKNVTFGYKKLSEPLIENFNLSLKPGAKVAFIGESGCGKSTLAKLISGLYTPWSGQILFDGKPAENIQREVFTSSLAVVDQDITVFEDTVCDNIKLWDNSIEDFEMILAARDAQIHEDISKRTGGYEYKLLEGGKDFSGGQRQRLEIARTLAQDPTIIILDEATSSLDSKTEHEVIKSITNRGITCIIIAHRLSTIRDCDEIIVLDNGKVIERGTHNELYSNNGRYKELITTE